MKLCHKLLHSDPIKVGPLPGQCGASFELHTAAGQKLPTVELTSPAAPPGSSLPSRSWVFIGNGNLCQHYSIQIICSPELEMVNICQLPNLPGIALPCQEAGRDGISKPTKAVLPQCNALREWVMHLTT
jgi:hypothetical protein